MACPYTERPPSPVAYNLHVEKYYICISNPFNLMKEVKLSQLDERLEMENGKKRCLFTKSFFHQCF